MCKVLDVAAKLQQTRSRRQREGASSSSHKEQFPPFFFFCCALPSRYCSYNMFTLSFPLGALGREIGTGRGSMPLGSCLKYVAWARCGRNGKRAVFAWERFLSKIESWNSREKSFSASLGNYSEKKIVERVETLMFWRAGFTARDNLFCKQACSGRVWRRIGCCRYACDVKRERLESNYLVYLE